MNMDEKLDEIRHQSKEDFKFIMIALDNTSQAMNGMMNTMNSMMGFATKEMGTVKARMARQEERFEMMLDAVQQELKQRVDPAIVADLVHRVEAIEKKIDAAA